MVSSKVLQLLFLVSTMTSQALIKGMVAEEANKIAFQVEGIAQRIEELPKELRYKIFSSALELRENPKYEIYKKLDVGFEVTGIALNADNTRALTGSNDNILRIWDVEKEELLKELKGHTDSIRSVALSADGTLALTSSYDETVRAWDTLTGTSTILQKGSTVFSVALSADGTIALTGSDDFIGRLYNTSTGELVKALKAHRGAVLSVALSADGTIALTGSRDKTARIWNALTGKLLKILLVGSDVFSVALSADGAIAIIVSDDGLAENRKVLVWDAKSGTLLNTLLPAVSVLSVALSKDGKRALVGTRDGKIQVWNTKPLPGKKKASTPLTVLEGHTKLVSALAFGSADFIASGSFDKSALIWKPFALEPRDPQEHQEILWQAYKETFSRPLLSSKNEKVQG